MKHMTREEALNGRVLQRARTVAIGSPPAIPRSAAYMSAGGSRHTKTIGDAPTTRNTWPRGGGHAAGGGVRAILHEKRMVKGAPSRRSGRFRPKPQ